MTSSEIQLTNNYQLVAANGSDYAIQAREGSTEFILSGTAPAATDKGIICNPGQGISSTVFGQSDVYARAIGVASSTSTVIVSV